MNTTPAPRMPRRPRTACTLVALMLSSCSTLEPPCRDEDACSRDCEAKAESIASPSGVPHQVLTSECETVTSMAVGRTISTCRCNLSDGGSWTLHGEEELGCPLRGRAGHCLFPSSSFTGCETTSPTECETQCALAAERHNEDRATPREVDLVATDCRGDECTCLFDVGEWCLENRYGEPTACP